MVFDWIVLAAFAGYLALMIFIGFFFSGRQESMGDYYLGGRRMNKWVVALSAQASDMSGWLLMGLPGAIYVGGFSEAWIGIGLLIGTYLNWKIVAQRLRTYSQVCGDSITIPDFINNRFRDRTGVSRIVAAAIILVFFTFYVASGFVSCAKLFTTTFGIPETIDWLGGTSGYTLCLWIGGAVVVAYTLLGGYMAVCWTDFIQGSIMFVAIVLVPAIVVCDAGGFASTVDSLNGINPYLQSLFTSAATAKATGFIGLVSCLAWGLGYFGMPHILVRFMSIDNPAEVKGSRRIAMTWVTISLAAATVIGLVFHLYLKQRGLALADVGGDPEKMFMIMINGIFSGGFLARIFAGMMLSAIMAAIMSTADSQLLVSASSFSNDLYKVLLRKKASDRELVLVSRLAVAAVALVAIAMAMNTQSDFFKVVMKMVSFAWAGFGAAFGPVILLALFWKRANLPGALAGMVVGASTCFVWKFVLSAKAAQYPIFGLYELAPGFLFALAATVVVSLLTKKPSAEMVDEFDGVAVSSVRNRDIKRLIDDAFDDAKVTDEERKRLHDAIAKLV
ncbi:MAG: sodium/proline symporter PutP [Kiritimatiellae bacterium]|nr:sodium/proline symporter PutP [Kiritimatiellia bacterium]